MNATQLTHQFLIAVPNMADPNFSRTVTYLCEHDENGALGLVLNRALDLDLGTLFEKVAISCATDAFSKRPVLYGGPVQLDRGFVLHEPQGNWSSSLMIRDRLALTTSKDILEAVAAGRGPERFLVTLGYAGWAAWQLEWEISQNAWLTVPAVESVIFDLPLEQRFEAAMGLLGVNFATLSEDAGHS